MSWGWSRGGDKQGRLGDGMIKIAVGRVLAMVAAAAWVTTGAVLLVPGAASAAGTVPRFDHVVIVVMENKNYNAIIGRPDEAPYINKLAASGAVFSNSFAVSHPREPNYLALFSGSTHGLSSDSCPKSFKTAPNLGAELISAGLSFTGYSESMPSDGSTRCGSEVSFGYTRVHNPWVDFSNVPAASNLTSAKFPADYRRMPPVPFVIPNLCAAIHSAPPGSRGKQTPKLHTRGTATRTPRP